MAEQIRDSDVDRWNRARIRAQREDDVDDTESDEEVVGEVEIAEADEFGYPMVKSLIQRLCNIDVVEMYSPPRVTLEAKKLALRQGEDTGRQKRCAGDSEAQRQNETRRKR